MWKERQLSDRNKFKKKALYYSNKYQSDFYVKNLLKFQYPTSRNFSENKIWHFILKIGYRILARCNFSNYTID